MLAFVDETNPLHVSNVIVWWQSHIPHMAKCCVPLALHYTPMTR